MDDIALRARLGVLEAEREETRQILCETLGITAGSAEDSLPMLATAVAVLLGMNRLNARRALDTADRLSRELEGAGRAILGGAA